MVYSKYPAAIVDTAAAIADTARGVQTPLFACQQGRAATVARARLSRAAAGIVQCVCARGVAAERLNLWWLRRVQSGGRGTSSYCDWDGDRFRFTRHCIHSDSDSRHMPRVQSVCRSRSILPIQARRRRSGVVRGRALEAIAESAAPDRAATAACPMCAERYLGAVPCCCYTTTIVVIVAIVAAATLPVDLGPGRGDGTTVVSLKGCRASLDGGRASLGYHEKVRACCHGGGTHAGRGLTHGTACSACTLPARSNEWSPCPSPTPCPARCHPAQLRDGAVGVGCARSRRLAARARGARRTHPARLRTSRLGSKRHGGGNIHRSSHTHTRSTCLSATDTWSYSKM